MSNTNQEKIKKAVDLLIDKDTDLTNFFCQRRHVKTVNQEYI